MNLMLRARALQQSLCFPGEEAREIWAYGADGVWQRADHSVGAVTAVEAIAFDSAPFWSFNAERLDEAVALRWEGFGIASEEGARLWHHCPVTRKSKHVLVGTLALREESSLPDSSAYEPSARMLPLPENGIAIWRELGRYVVAFTREAALLHIAVLTSRSLDVDAAFDIRDEFAALHTHGFISEVSTIHLWSQCETDFVPQLACLFESAGVIKQPRPDPRLPHEASGLLPVQVAVRRRRQCRRKNQRLILAAAAMLYISLFGAWWLRLQWIASDLNHAEAVLAAEQPEIDLVREAQSNWLEMETSINPDLYPVELFHQVVSLLPEEGIRLKEFQIEDGRLIVSGEASTVNHALGFKGRLESCVPLQRYAWRFPVPTIREDNRADFRAEGTLTGGALHEAQ